MEPNVRSYKQPCSVMEPKVIFMLRFVILPIEVS